MARKSNIEPLQKALNPQDQPERFRLGEISNSGLKIFSGIPAEELKRELDFPENIKTYKLMSYHPAVNAALTLYSSMIAKARYRIIAPKDATEEEKRQAKILGEMLFEDMEHPFEDVIQDALTMSIYGFSVSEKVYRKRSRASGSLFDDNLIAPKKIAIRHQSSIDKFIFSEDGNSILGVKQVITSDTMGRFSRRESDIVIPRSKFMLFTAGGTKDNPYGVSPLRNIYLPWKYLSALEELEAQGVQKELHGIPVLSIPAQYMSSEATPEQKVIFENMKNIVRNLQQGSQAGVVLPSSVDPETRQKLFDITLLSTDGKKAYDLTEIKEYYRGLIFIGMSADILLLGNAGTGSFALASVKNTLTGNAIENYLKKIMHVINSDLVRQIYDLNGWDARRMAKVDYENLSEESLEEISKYFQRITSVGMMPKTVDTVNYILSTLGLEPLPEDTNQEDLEELLSASTTRAGDGMQVGKTGNGTSDAVSSTDTSSLNQDNAA